MADRSGGRAFLGRVARQSRSAMAHEAGTGDLTVMAGSDILWRNDTRYGRGMVDEWRAGPLSANARHGTDELGREPASFRFDVGATRAYESSPHAAAECGFSKLSS